MSFVELTGHAKLDRRTKNLVKRLSAKNLVKRLSADDIAIIDHTDLDRVVAEELVESGVRVVVNVAQSQSGRFPNPGPLALVRAGVRLIEVPEADLFDVVHEGELLTVRGAGLYRNGSRLAIGRVLDENELERSLAEQRGRVTEALEAFAENTMRYLREEGKLLAEGIEFPPLATRFRDRHALVVARGPGYKRDLRMVKPYVRDFKPVLIALQRLELDHRVVRATGISEDLALLLAYEKGSELIVAVGTHFNLIEFLERNRAGMSSTFVTRLKVGEILIDAKGVSRLASRQVGIWPLVLFTLAGLGAIAVAVAVSPALRHLIEYIALRLRDLLGIG